MFGTTISRTEKLIREAAAEVHNGGRPLIAAGNEARRGELRRRLSILLQEDAWSADEADHIARVVIV